MENYKSYKTKYHYCYFGNIQMWELTHLESKPIDYDSVEYAMNCNATLVFRKDNEHIVLAIPHSIREELN